MLQLKTGQKPCTVPNRSCFWVYMTDRLSITQMPGYELTDRWVRRCQRDIPQQWLVLHHDLRSDSIDYDRWVNRCFSEISWTDLQTYKHGQTDWCHPVFQTDWQTEKPGSFYHDSLKIPSPRSTPVFCTSTVVSVWPLPWVKPFSEIP